MKTTPALLGLLWSGIFVLPLPAAVVVRYSSDLAPEDESLPVAPSYSPYDAYKGSSLAAVAGSGIARKPQSLTFGEWGTEIQLDRYVSFSVSVDPGFELHVTHLDFETLGSGNPAGRSSFGNVSSYMWGYRVDPDGADGPAGFQEWVFGQMFNPEYPDYNPPNSWEIEGLYVTGTIEFGLFASSGFPGGEISLETVSVRGAVPEPDSLLLGALGCGLALAGRRKIKR